MADKINTTKDPFIVAVTEHEPQSAKKGNFSAKNKQHMQASVNVEFNASSGMEQVNAAVEALKHTFDSQPDLVYQRQGRSKASETQDMPLFNVSAPSYNPAAKTAKVTIRHRPLARGLSLPEGVDAALTTERVIHALERTEAGGKKLASAKDFADAPEKKTESRGR